MPPFSTTETLSSSLSNRSDTNDNDDKEYQSKLYDASCKDTCCRSINFDLSKNDIYFISLIDDMSKEEIEETWYDDIEQSMIKSRTRIFITMMKNGIEENDNVTYRGLESKSIKGSEKRRERQERAIRTLYNVQTDARRKGVNDPEGLAQAMRNCTWEAQKEAIDVGKNDEHFVVQQQQQGFNDDDHHHQTYHHNDDTIVSNTTQQAVVKCQSSQQLEHDDDVDTLLANDTLNTPQIPLTKQNDDNNVSKNHQRRQISLGSRMHLFTRRGKKTGGKNLKSNSDRSRQ